MKLVLLILTLPFWTLAQSADTTSICREIIDFPDKEAEFPGGIVAFHKFVVEYINLELPDGEMHLPGKITFSFVVDATGRISEVEINEGGEKWSNSAIEMLTQMPNWIPASHGGKTVCSRVYLPMYINYE